MGDAMDVDRQEAVKPDPDAPMQATSSAIEAAKAAGNINVAGTQHTEVLELSEESKMAQERHAEALKAVEIASKARTMIVPTATEEVRARLRRLGQPVCLFGEKIDDTRERLKRLMGELELMGGETGEHAAISAGAAAVIGATQAAAAEAAAPKEAQKEVVYTPASEALLAARKLIADFSFVRAQERLTTAKSKRDVPMEVVQQDEVASSLFQAMRSMGLHVSAVGDDRPLSSVRVAPSGKEVACGGWSGLIKLWDIEGLDHKKTLKGHAGRVTGLSWHPKAYTSSDPPLLVSGGTDATARVWSAKTGGCVQSLTGHAGRLARVAFHPSGMYVGTTSFDHTWRLWDVESGKELLLQDGHKCEVYSIAFQNDGALVATGDFTGVGHIWDLRSGKSIWATVGHVKKITCSDFSPSGYEVATGSDDCSVRFWDIRKKGGVYCLPAHSSLISDLRYGETETLLTSAFDNTCKIWSLRNYSLLGTLRGHEGKVVNCDFAPGQKRIVTCSFDHTIRVWEAGGV